MNPICKREHPISPACLMNPRLYPSRHFSGAPRPSTIVTSISLYPTRALRSSGRRSWWPCWETITQCDPSGTQRESRERQKGTRVKTGNVSRGGRREEGGRVSSAGRTCPPLHRCSAGRCTAGVTLGRLRRATSLSGDHLLEDVCWRDVAAKFVSSYGRELFSEQRAMAKSSFRSTDE